MNEPTLIQSKITLPIDQVEIDGRLRPVSAAGVETLVASIAEIGQITNPITVRQLRRDGAYSFRIIDGAHRYTAAVQLGWSEIPVRVFECTDDQARLMEIDGNLAGAELNPLDTAVFFATRKAVYERLHPETKAGIAGANARWNASELSSFASVTAEKFGMTARQVQKIVAAGSRLGSDEIAKLRSAPRQVTLKDLLDIGGIKEAPHRNGVVDALAAGQAKNAAAAFKALQPPVERPVQSQVEEQLTALLKAWDRAGMSAQRRFVAERIDTLGLLVAHHTNNQDGIGVAAE